jgi:RNA-directed DNA polymerase
MAELAQQYNSVLRGWWEYYGAFYQTAMREIFRYVDRKLEQWARRKYQTLMRHKRRSVEWLDRVKKARPEIFVHWRVFRDQGWTARAV